MRTLALERCTVCGAGGGVPAELGLLRCPACDTVRAPEYADPDEVFRDGYLAGGTGSFGIDLSHPRWQEYLAAVGDRRCDELAQRGQTPPCHRLLDVGCGSGEFL